MNNSLFSAILNSRASVVILACVVASCSLSACGGGEYHETYSIGGSVSGMPASGSVSLLYNGGFEMIVSADGKFSFPMLVEDGSKYTVSISSSPTEYVCSIENQTGVVKANDVVDISVLCHPGAVSIQVEN